MEASPGAGAGSAGTCTCHACGRTQLMHGRCHHPACCELMSDALLKETDTACLCPWLSSCKRMAVSLALHADLTAEASMGPELKDSRKHKVLHVACRRLPKPLLYLACKQGAGRQPSEVGLPMSCLRPQQSTAVRAPAMQMASSRTSAPAQSLWSLSAAEPPPLGARTKPLQAGRSHCVPPSL